MQVVTTTETIGPDQLLTSTEVGRLLQVNPSSVKKWVNDGYIVAFRTPGGHRRIRALDLIGFLDQHKIPVPLLLANAARRRLIVVDADHAHLKTIGRGLKRWSDKLEVTLFDNGVDALLEIGRARPHALLVDIDLPRFEVIDVCKRLKSNPGAKDMAIIVTCGRLTAEVEHAARACGVRRVLRKPVDAPVVAEELGLLPATVAR